MTALERLRFEENAAAFRAHYGEAAALYSVEIGAATISPQVSLAREGLGGGPAIHLVSGPSNAKAFAAAAESFIERWSELLNPYGLSLTARDEEARDVHVSRSYTQSYCGVPLVAAQAEYAGVMNITALGSDSKLLSVQSGLVPLRPLPKPALEPSDVRNSLLGARLGATGCHQGVFTENTCITAGPSLVVFVRPAGDVLEYYIAYQLEFALEGCDDRADWTLIVDAIDGQPLHQLVERICPDYG